MKLYAINVEGVPSQIYPALSFVDASGTIHPANWNEVWGEEDYLERGVFRVEEAPVPEGKFIRAQALRFENVAEEGEPEELVLVHEVELADIPEPSLPLEIPMHKAKKALEIWSPNGREQEPCWRELVEDAMNAIPNRISRNNAKHEWNNAQNLVLNGATTLAIMSAIGMTGEQLDEVAREALTLP
jgi:hypothetical protein